jgi:hypothetical protein
MLIVSNNFFQKKSVDKEVDYKNVSYSPFIPCSGYFKSHHLMPKTISLTFEGLRVLMKLTI